MEMGRLTMIGSDDGAGGMLVTVYFGPAGGGLVQQVGDPQPFGVGDSIYIEPGCVQCDLTSTVGRGDQTPVPPPAPHEEQPAPKAAPAPPVAPTSRTPANRGSGPHRPGTAGS